MESKKARIKELLKELHEELKTEFDLVGDEKVSFRPLPTGGYELEIVHKF